MTMRTDSTQAIVEFQMRLADSLPPASQHPTRACLRMLDDAWVRLHCVRDTRQKTSSRDLHNTGLYLKVAHATVLSRAYFMRKLRLTQLQNRSFQRLSRRRRSFCSPLEIHGVLELPAELYMAAIAIRK